MQGLDDELRFVLRRWKKWEILQKKWLRCTGNHAFIVATTAHVLLLLCFLRTEEWIVCVHSSEQVGCMNLHDHFSSRHQPPPMALVSSRRREILSKF